MSELTVEVVRFDASVYSIETIKKAAYRLLNLFSPNIELQGTTIVCSLSFPQGATSSAVADAVAEFRKEVLDQDLRQLIASETAQYRDAILALAFSSTELTKDE